MHILAAPQKRLANVLSNLYICKYICEYICQKKYSAFLVLCAYTANCKSENALQHVDRVQIFKRYYYHQIYIILHKPVPFLSFELGLGLLIQGRNELQSNFEKICIVIVYLYIVYTLHMSTQQQL